MSVKTGKVLVRFTQRRMPCHFMADHSRWKPPADTGKVTKAEESVKRM